MNLQTGHTKPSAMGDDTSEDFMVVTLYFDTHDFTYSGPLKFRNTPINNGAQFWSIPRAREKTLLVIAVDETQNCHNALPEVWPLVTDIVRKLGTEYANFGAVMVVRFGEKDFQFAPSQCSGTIGVFRKDGNDSFSVDRKKRPYFTPEESGCRLTSGALVPYDSLFVSHSPIISFNLF